MGAEGLARSRLGLAALLAAAAVVYSVGAVNDLPYVVQPDEVLYFGRPAARMAATGSLNPGWFGHPASTILYPLGGLYHLWHALVHRGSWLHPDPRLLTTFEAQVGGFLLLGRLLSAAYGVAALGMLYVFGRRLFDAPTALLAVAWMIPVPHLVLFAQGVRNDTATLFYSLLALWAILRVLERPTLGRQAVAGLACGLAISTKYYLGMLAAMLALADGLLLWQGRKVPHQKRLFLGMAVGMAAVAVGFVLTTPFFVLDFPTARQDLARELRSTHLGADGLSPLENLIWYVSTALPDLLGWGRYLVSLAGAAWVAWRGGAKRRWVLAFPLAFLSGISASPLHWHRWTFPVLPILALSAAFAILEGMRWLQRQSFSPFKARALAALFSLALCAEPLYQTVRLEVQQVRPSTMVQTRQWLDVHLPPGAVIAREEYSFPQNGVTFTIIGGNALGEKPLEYYREQGAEFVAISSAIYERYYREPERYATQIAFYERLEAEEELIYEAVPGPWQGGPTVRIYRLHPGGEGASSGTTR